MSNLCAAFCCADLDKTTPFSLNGGLNSYSDIVDYALQMKRLLAQVAKLKYAATARR